jgi:hypothetical protein
MAEQGKLGSRRGEVAGWRRRNDDTYIIMYVRHNIGWLPHEFGDGLIGVDYTLAGLVIRLGIWSSRTIQAKSFI